MNVSIYCDGSSEGNSTGKGGAAYVILANGRVVAERGEHIEVATNNIAEIQAAISGLEHFLQRVQDNSIRPTSVELVSDSQLVLRYATGEYRCKAQHLVPYYIKLRKLYGEAKATTRWVKGHAGDEFNEKCDKLAKAARIGNECNLTYDVIDEPAST